jgi:hypothetical protein
VCRVPQHAAYGNPPTSPPSRGRRVSISPELRLALAVALVTGRGFNVALALLARAVGEDLLTNSLCRSLRCNLHMVNRRQRAITARVRETMKTYCFALAALAAIGFAGGAYAGDAKSKVTAPQAMSDSEMDKVTAGREMTVFLPDAAPGNCPGHPCVGGQTTGGGPSDSAILQIKDHAAVAFSH